MTPAAPHRRGERLTALAFAGLCAAFSACATSSPPGPAPAGAPATAPEDPDEAAAAAAAEAPPPPEPPASREPVESVESLLGGAAAGATAPPDPNAPADVKAAPSDASTTPSGLASKLLQRGAGSDHPRAEDSVRISYTAWMSSGVKFESSLDRGQPVEIALAGAIPGLAEGLRLMVAGERRRFWIPGALAYGDAPRGAGLPYGTLVYDVELVSIRRAPEVPQVPSDLDAPPATAKRTPSGIAYQVLNKGTGTTHPRAGSTVEVHYSGWSLDGKMFDSSVARGTPASFSLRNVIRGWTEGVQLMVVGEKTRFWIPSKLAYGDKPGPGSPAGPLVFDIELLDIK